ncbi:MAG: hypothetical protein JWM25_1917, partial [Thermoleophilia bacterium]|nr:hypothetical protein [Thermoleophilia bacterium]
MNAARMQPGPRAIAPPWAIVLLACALAACCGWGLGVAPARAAAAGTPATSTPDKRIRAWSDRELATAEHRLDLEAQGVGNSLLMADERRHEAGRERDAAFQLLSRWMAVSYRDASSQSAITSLLSGGNLRQLSERVRLARTLTRYHDGLVTSLDEAEASLQLTALERTRLVQQLTAAQHELAGVRAEQARR